MRKKLYILLVCSLIAIGSSSCGVSAEAQTEKETTQNAQDIIRGSVTDTDYEDIVVDDWHYSTKFVNTGFSYWRDLIQFAGDLYYDRYTRIVYMYTYQCTLHSESINITPYYGPHGHLCQYSPEKKKIIELEN